MERTERIARGLKHYFNEEYSEDRKEHFRIIVSDRMDEERENLISYVVRNGYVPRPVCDKFIKYYSFFSNFMDYYHAV